MTKIRKFRVDLRVKELARRAKRAKLDLAAAGLADEAALRAFCGGFAARLEPAVVYQSLPAEHELAKLAPVPGLGCSLGMASLGSGPELLAAELEAAGEQAKLPLLTLARELALEDATAFVLSLVKQEAEEDECELSPIACLTEAPALEAAAAELQAAKIGVSVSEGRLSPEASSAFSLSWIAKPRSRKTARR